MQASTASRPNVLCVMQGSQNQDQQKIVKLVNYHAHVYFSEHERRAAETIRVQVKKDFGDEIKIGSWHERPVGPHPRGSYQLTVAPEQMAEFLPWMSMNRAKLTVFMHLNTGDNYTDHTLHVIWLGESEKLNLSIFE